MLWAAFLTAFFGLLRSSEFVAPTITTFNKLCTLLITHVHFVGTHIHIQIKTSKTDPFQGCTIKLAPTHHNICPVAALKGFLEAHPTQHGPLFAYADGTYLTRRRLNTLLQTAIPNTETGKTSSHSFRIRAASTAAASGMTRWLIQQMKRWNSDSFRTYIQIPENTIDWVAQALTKRTHS